MAEIDTSRFKSTKGDKNLIEASCASCEFNMGVCAGYGERAYKYGEEITDDTKVCTDWGISLAAFVQQEKANGR
jgi:hypothetical protein